MLSLLKTKAATMTRILDISRAFYLLVLGISAGAIIATGALSAPVIFNMDSILGLGISNAESGLVMGNIFSRLNYVLLALMIVMIIYEIVCVFAKSSYRIPCLILLIINIVCILLFVFYYSPFLLNQENLADENFDLAHKQSVLVFKILMTTLMLSFLCHAFYYLRKH